MNILEAFDAALPEIPARSGRRSYPKLDSRVISKQHFEHEVPIILAKMPGSDSFLRLTTEQWKLLGLFDGNRSYKDISELIQARDGIAFTEDDVKEFASFLRDETDLFYATPLEKSITLKQKLGSHRHKRKRFAFSDITDITLHRWPHADDYLTRLQPYVSFIYTRWFVGLTLIAFAVMLWMWIGKFSEIWYDSFRFYNFTSKTAWDLFEFWILFGVMAFFHETAHGMTCKHFGGNVEKMEFLLMYFAPTFVCDVTQIWILGGRKARLSTIIAGIWVDLIICFFATALWWTTPVGLWAHDLGYKVMMVSGIGVTLVNLNPLIKLDGYYMLSELLGEVDLKERSTLYVSEWVKRNLFFLPVEVEYVPRRRRFLYLMYALLSGIYSYSLISVLIFFAYHVIASYSPELAWIPGLLLALLVFKSRIRKLVRFMKDVYLDKRDRVKNWFTPARITIVSALAVLVLFLPLWPNFVDARFVLEPSRRAVVRAEVQGTVTQVLTGENQAVTAGTPIVQLQNLQLESALAQAAAALQEVSARATNASLKYLNFSRLEHEREDAMQRNRALAKEVARLQVASPISGVVVTPRLQDLVGSYVDVGAKVVEIADLSTMTARIYIPEFGVRDVRKGARARLHLQSRLLPVSGTLAMIEPLSSDLDPALVEKEQLNGIVPPPFYVGLVNVANDGSLREGMTGTAKLYVGRRSPAQLISRFVRDSVQRRFW